MVHMIIYDINDWPVTFSLNLGLHKDVLGVEKFAKKYNLGQQIFLSVYFQHFWSRSEHSCLSILKMSEGMSSGVFFVSADSKRERRPLNQSESNKWRKHGDPSGIFTVDFFWIRVRNDFSFSNSILNHCTAKWLIYHRPISLTHLVCQGQGHYCPSLSNKNNLKVFWALFFE